MRNLIVLLLSLSITLGPLAAVAGDVDLNDLETRTAQQAFKNDLHDRVLSFMDMNVAYLANLQLCLTGKPTLMDCEEKLATVRANIKIQYPIMRRYLLLKDLLQPLTHAKLVQAYESQYDAFVEGKESTQVIPIKDLLRPNPLSRSNFIKGIWEEDNLPKVPFTNEEIKNAIEGSSVVIEGTNYLEGLRGYEKWYCELTFGKNHPGCQSMQLEYVADKNSFRMKKLTQNPWVGQDMIRALNDLADKSSKQQIAALKLMKEKFYEIVQMNPYVALMTSANPSNEEILHAVQLMYGKALIALHKFEEQMAKIEKNENGDIAELMALMDYLPVAMSVLDEPGENMQLVDFDYNSLFEEITDQHTIFELKKSTLRLVALIGANMLVCMGGGKIVKNLVIARKVMKLQRWADFFNPLCFSLSQIPINGWFVIDSLNYYHKTFTEVFSSADGEHFITEVNSLSAAQRGIFWSVALSGTGWSGSTMKTLTRSGIKLSERFIKRLTRAKPLK